MFEFYSSHIKTIIFKIKYLCYVKNLKLSITHNTYLDLPHQVGIMCDHLNNVIKFQYLTNNITLYNFNKFPKSKVSSDTKFLSLFNSVYLESLKSSSFKNLDALRTK